MKRPHSQRGEVSSRRSRLSTAPQEYLRPHISATSDKPPRITKGVGQRARQNSIRGSSVYLGAIGRHLARHSMARYHRGQGSTSPGPAIHICTHIFFLCFSNRCAFLSVYISVQNLRFLLFRKKLKYMLQFIENLLNNMCYKNRF